MKNTQKPVFSTAEKITFISIIVILAPIWLPVMILLMFGFFLRYVKIVRAIQMQPLYWLTWHEVKRATGKQSHVVLDCLRAGTEANFFECRYRDRETVVKLMRRRRRAVPPPPTGPAISDDAIFYEFRFKARGGKRSPKFADFFSRFIPRARPLFQPAYR